MRPTSSTGTTNLERSTIPADVRRRNLIDAAELPFATASGLVIDSGDPKESLERALAAVDYSKLRAAPRRSASGKYRGVGLGAYTEFTGMGSGTFRRRGMMQVPGHDAATVRVEPTGDRRIPETGRPAVLYRRGPALTLNPPLLRNGTAAR